MDKEGVDLKGVWNVLKEGISTPELAGKSIGFMAPMMVGGPTSLLGKEVAAAARAAKIAEAAGDSAAIAKTTERLEKAKDAYDNTTKALDFVSKQAGIVGVSIGGTNDDLEEYAKKA